MTMDGHPCFEDVAAMRREQAADNATAKAQREEEIELLKAISAKLSNGLGKEIAAQIVQSSARTNRELGRLRKILIGLAITIALGLVKVAPETAAAITKWLGQ